MRSLPFFLSSFTLLLSCLMATGNNVMSSSLTQFRHEQLMRKWGMPSVLNKFAPPRQESGQEVVDAFIAIDNATAIDRLTRIGVKVQSIFDGFVTASVPVNQLDRVTGIAGVIDIELSRRVELCTDSTLSVTRAGLLHDGPHHGLPSRYDGTGVVVGVIDRGFDYQHRAFRRADDASVTRIVRVYDTSKTTGHPVLSDQGAVLPGSVFMNDEIYSLTTDYSGTHGTHTSSIAAGTHVNGYGGMAPGVDIVLCAVSRLDGGLSTVEIANCVRYITCYADSVGKPCVMSMSVSTPTGQHDGEDYLSRAIAQSTGSGRLFVISAGNCGDRPMYAHKQVTRSNPFNLLFKSKPIADEDSSYYYSNLNADIWLRGARTLPAYRLHILDLKSGHIVWQSDYMYTSGEFSTQVSNYFKPNTSTSSDGSINVSVGTSSNGKSYNVDVWVVNMMCRQYTIVNGTKQSRHAIGISIYPRDNAQSDADAWLTHSSSRFASYYKPVVTMEGDTITDFYTPSNNDCTIGTYAVNDSIISAGAYAARNSFFSLLRNRVVQNEDITVGEIANFSSFQVAGAGPTGAPLPTICAPGIYVVAAASRYSYLTNHNTTVMRTDDGHYWGVLSGTSMSAPTVAGIIAQWLQANPALSVAEVKEILAESAIHDQFTTGANSVMFGPNGKIDAMGGIRLVLQRMNREAGDVNCDGRVGMDDLSLLISHLLGHYPAEEIFSEANADVNHSGHVNMDDLSDMINLLLHHW